LLSPAIADGTRAAFEQSAAAPSTIAEIHLCHITGRIISRGPGFADRDAFCDLGDGLLPLAAMTVEILTAWLLSIMLTTVPPGRSRRPAEARESAEAGRARYAAIARAMAQVSLDPEEAPLFDGERAREKTALFLLTISLHESHWMRHVDLGLGPQARGGGGRYHCMMQILVKGEATPEGFTKADLVKSRDKCFRRGLHILQRAKRFCDEAGPRAFLNHYASGTCHRGARAAAKRWKTFDRLSSEHGWPKPLEQLHEQLHEGPRDASSP